MASQKTGRVTVSWDGNNLKSKPGASFQPGGVQRKENGMDDQGGFFYQEILVPGMIKCTLIHVSDVDLIALRDVKGADVQYSTDTGNVYTIPGGVFTEFGDLSNGEIDVTFMGSPAKGS
jgi:hypothetical protein